MLIIRTKMYSNGMHQIINNFAGNSIGMTWPYHNASEAFERYIANANFDSPNNGSFYFSFRCDIRCS